MILGETMKKIITLIYILLFTACVPSHSIVKNSVTLKVTQPNQKAMILEQLHVDTKIYGNIAQTTLEFSFYNPNKRVLEGSLEFPLLDGQSIVKHALEIDGKYRESVVVEKSKAKKVFEDVIRKRVDPSIVEKTIGNNFRLRLYPLRPKKSKRVKITIEEILPLKSNHYEYRLPFITDETIKKFSLKITSDSKSKPILNFFEESDPFELYKDGYQFSYETKNVQLNKAVALEIPVTQRVHSYYQDLEERRVFISVLHKKRATPLKATKDKQKLQLIWDSSLSASESSLTKKIEFLEILFSQKVEYEVSLFSLGLTMKSEGVYSVKNGNWKNLKERLKAIRYHGAKDMSALKIEQEVDKVLLFTNGLNTFSDELTTDASKPIYTFNSNVRSAPNVLKHLAKMSGGKYINLLRDSSSEALNTFKGQTGSKVIKKSYNVEEVFIEERGESLIVFGSMIGQNANLIIEHAGNEYEIVLDDAKENPYVARLWATEKIDSLSLNRRKNKKRMIAMAKKYQIVTSFTSMIVLDELDDYVRYEIVPPKELLASYNRAMERKRKWDSKEAAIVQVTRLIEEQKIWYAKNFPKKRPEKKAKTSQDDNLEEYGGSGEGGDISPVIAFEQEPVVAPSPVASSPNKEISSKKKVKLVTTDPKIKLKEWVSDAIYMKEMQELSADTSVAHYFKLQKEHKNEASFYVDMADYFYKNNNQAFALEILSNLLEIDYENSELIRVFAFKLLEHKEAKKSIHFFEMIAELRPFEAQSSRDLALALEEAKEYQRALELHYKILTTFWDERFGGSKIVTVNEMNHLIKQHEVDSSKIDPRLLIDMPVEIRIVINWSTDNSDMDLWVIDPFGEKTYYAHRESFIGGKISNDMTQGYGPEEFMIREAVKGNYKIKVKYYASHQQKIAGPTVIRAEVYTNYGYKNEKKQEIIFRVEEEKDVVDVGEISY